MDYLPDPSNRANRFRLAKTPKGFYSVSYREPEKSCKSQDDAVLTSHAVEQVASRFVRAQASLVELARKYNIPVEEMNPNLELLQGMLEEAVGGLHASHTRANSFASKPSSEKSEKNDKPNAKAASSNANKASSSASSSSPASSSAAATDTEQTEEKRVRSMILDWRRRGWIKHTVTRPFAHSAAFHGCKAAASMLELDLRFTTSVVPFGLPCFLPWDNSSTGTHCAAASGNASLLGNVLVEGLDLIELKTKTEKFPVSFAAAYGGAATLRFLLDCGVKKLDNPTDNTPGLGITHFAAMGGDSAALALLTSQGFQLNASDKMDLVPMHYAAARGHTNLIKWFFDRDVKIAKNSKLSLIHASALAPNPELIEYLHECRSLDLNAVDSFGANAAHYAAASGSVPVLHYLARKGVNLNLTAQGGYTPFLILLLVESRLDPQNARLFKDALEDNGVDPDYVKRDILASTTRPAIANWFVKLEGVSGSTYLTDELMH